MKELILNKNELARLYIDNIYVGCLQPYHQRQLKLNIFNNEEEKMICIAARGANINICNRIEILFFKTKEFQNIFYSDNEEEYKKIE